MRSNIFVIRENWKISDSHCALDRQYVWTLSKREFQLCAAAERFLDVEILYAFINCTASVACAIFTWKIA